MEYDCKGDKAYRLSERSLRILSKFSEVEENKCSNNDCILPTLQNNVFNINFELHDPSVRIDPNTGEDKGVIDLLKLTGSMGNISFQKRKFSAATFRTKNSSSMQVFNKGRSVVAGSRNKNSVLFVVHYLRFFLESIGQPVRQGKIFRVNRVCSGDVGHPIDIDNFEEDDTIGTVKRDESFPGIIYFVESKKTKTRMMFLVFKTGKFIVMGLLDNGDEEAYEAFETVLPVLRRNRLNKKLKSNYMPKSIERIKSQISDKFDTLLTNENEEKIFEKMKAVVSDELRIK